MKSLLRIGLLSLAVTALMAGSAMYSVPTAQAQEDPCKQDPKNCILVPIDWFKGKWPWPPPPDCPMCGLIKDWKDVLSLPDNQPFIVTVKHGPQADTVVIQVPKELSGPLLQNQNMTMGK
jgi:hypothetical protein